MSPRPPLAEAAEGIATRAIARSRRPRAAPPNMSYWRRRSGSRRVS